MEVLVNAMVVIIYNILLYGNMLVYQIKMSYTLWYAKYISMKL